MVCKSVCVCSHTECENRVNRQERKGDRKGLTFIESLLSLKRPVGKHPVWPTVPVKKKKNRQDKKKGSRKETEMQSKAH